MKKILYVYAHPNPDSFNHALQQHGVAYLKQQGIELKSSNLYEMKFNPVASWEDFGQDSQSQQQYFLAQQAAFQSNTLSKDIEQELQKVIWADHILLQFPLWWFSMPAILKGWFDRVLVKGFAYDAGKVFDLGLLKGKTASLVLSTQSPESAYRSNDLHSASMDSFLHPIHHTLKFVGIKPLSSFVSYGVFHIETSRQSELFRLYQTYLQSLLHN